VDALDCAAAYQGSIHLVLTDVVMPGMSGRQMLDQLRARHPEVRVLYMSGYTADAIVHHGVFDPGTPYLQKPFALPSLARKVREALAS
jgi:two-component system cell cycle sensor histidine kinase/response regulator CckA